MQFDLYATVILDQKKLKPLEYEFNEVQIKQW